MKTKLFKKSLLLVVSVLFTNAIYSQSVTIAAAADLRYAMPDLVNLYKKQNPDAKIEVIYGSSGNAFQQIQNDAPYDIFFSADIMYPQKLKEKGLTISKPKLYAIGRIVIWSQTIDVSKGMNSFLEPKINKIALANPEHAPYGKRGEEAMKYYGIYDKIKSKLVLGENVSQTAQFIVTGNAEIGVLALSLVLSPAMKNQGKYFLIDSKSHNPLEQAYVILKHAQNNKEAVKFTKFIASPQARAIFKQYGFVLPKEQ